MLYIIILKHQSIAGQFFSDFHFHAQNCDCDVWGLAYTETNTWRRQVFKSGGMISDFWPKKKHIENKCEGAERPSPRERSDRAGEGVEGGCPPSHGREIFHFWGSESCNLVHAVMKLLTLYLIRIWIKIINYISQHIPKQDLN